MKHLLVCVVPVLCSMMGCAVGQAPGKGQVLHLQEQSTKGWFYLYLPEDYKSPKSESGSPASSSPKHWPVVITFHGMKPFDNSAKQIREWQQEADRYGFVVIAPQLRSPDWLAQFPLRTVHSGVKYDEKLTIGALDEVARRVDINPSTVLSTSWSSGGYIAHYMVNRFPDRFSCIATKQSNFSASVLDPKQVEKYRHMKVGIFYTENDFAVCKRESQAAAKWYAKHGFDVTFAVFKNLGHVRRPSIAADFFARTCNASAKTPPTELARLQIKNMPIPTHKRTSPTPAQQPQVASSKPTRTSDPKYAGATPQRAPHQSPKQSVAVSGRQDIGRPRNDFGDAYDPNNVARSPGSKPASSTQKPKATNTRPANKPRPTSQRGALPENKPPSNPLRVRVSSTIGVSPLMVSFSAVAPGPLRRGAYFLWTDNGEPISNGINGQKYLLAPGEHVLAVLMTTPAGKEFRATKTIKVLERTRRGRRP
ncbi:MAG: hypothetical protein GXP29_14680 [Planctomycetes bacterium]|nr:hypothetical protein [Planctomycetota bacterium]